MMETINTARMSEQQRAWFYAEYERARKDEVMGVLLALFLGGFGIHQFYMGRNGLGVVYLLLSWTGIPTIMGWVECFFMPGRIREYNAGQAAYIAGQIAASGVGATGGNVAPSYVAQERVPSGDVVAEYVPSGGGSLAGVRSTGASVDRICGVCGMTMEVSAAFCPRCGAAAV